jgi:SAF domain
VTVVRPAPTPSAPSPIPSANGFGAPPPPPRRPRNIAGATLGVLLVLLCATAVAVYTSNAGHRRPVLVMVRSVRAGAAISAGDIGEARVAADPSVRALPASARARVIGRIAAFDIAGGTLLTTAELATGPEVAAGFSVVGLNVKLGYAPAGLRPSVRVRLAFTPNGTSGAPDSAQLGANGSGSVLVPEARVFDVAATPDGQGQIVSVIVDDASAPALAAAGARGQVSVILLGGTG